MNLGEWLQSKKTKDMLTTQILIAGVILGIVAIAKGDPDKVKALLDAVQNALLMLAGVGGTKIAAQAHVDGKLVVAGKK